VLKTKIIPAFFGFLSLIVLLNPGAGLFFEIPDNIPLIGNLDEGAATLLLVWAVRTLLQKNPPKPPATP
jgi:hypothetical protein